MNASTELSSSFKKAVAGHLQVRPENIFLFWKGRVGLYALLKAMGVGKGDEVILPAFTCVVVPNAVIYLGAKPVYVDIDERTFNINVDLVRDKIGPRTKIILAQNTFGLPPDLEAIHALARENNLRVIEDCTHGFGGHDGGNPNGTSADASFFSTQWNKPFSTGIGGFAYVKDPGLISSVRETERNLLQPTVKDKLMLTAMIAVRNMLSNSSAYWAAIKTYRWMSRRGLVIGSSEDAELTNVQMPGNYLKAMSTVQMEHGIKQLSRIRDLVGRRISIADRYTKYLSGKNIPVPFIPPGKEHTFLKYPLMVNDRKLFFEKAQQAKVEIGDWFLSPIHPVTKNFERWNYTYGNYPVAEKAAAQVVNLPTNPSMGNDEVEKVISFLSANMQNIV